MSRLSKANYLGHQNLKNGLEREKNVAILNSVLEQNASGGTKFKTADFSYRIGSTLYSKTAATHEITGNVAESKYAAYVVLVDKDGTIRTLKGADAASKTLAISALVDVDVPSDEAVVGFLVVTGAFTAGTTVTTAETTIDYYSCGVSVALSSGKTAAGNSLLAAL